MNKEKEGKLRFGKKSSSYAYFGEVMTRQDSGLGSVGSFVRSYVHTYIHPSIPPPTHRTEEDKYNNFLLQKG